MELLNIVRSAELHSDKMTHTQILDALKNLFLQRQKPFNDIKSDGKGPIAKALANLGLGTAATKDVGTGTGQLPDMSRFSASLPANGWQKPPSELLLQWGNVSAEKLAAETPAQFYFR